VGWGRTLDPSHFWGVTKIGFGRELGGRDFFRELDLGEGTLV